MAYAIGVESGPIRERSGMKAKTGAWARWDRWTGTDERCQGEQKTRILEAGNLESLTESQRHRQRARGRHRFNQVAVLGLDREFGKFVEYVIDVKKHAPAVLAIKIQMKIDQLIGPGHEVSRILRG